MFEILFLSTRAGKFKSRYKKFEQQDSRDNILKKLQKPQHLLCRLEAAMNRRQEISVCTNETSTSYRTRFRNYIITIAAR